MDLELELAELDEDKRAGQLERTASTISTYAVAAGGVVKHLNAPIGAATLAALA